MSWRFSGRKIDFVRLQRPRTGSSAWSAAAPARYAMPLQPLQHQRYRRSEEKKIPILCVRIIP
jgi:hypothetical protein